MSKHTPGPWLVNRDYLTFLQIETADQVSIADVDCDNDNGRSACPSAEHLANAKLIAQAPVMHEQIAMFKAKILELEMENNRLNQRVSNLIDDIDLAYGRRLEV